MNPLPKFARLRVKPTDLGTCLRLKGNRYYRDGGAWEIGFQWVGGMLKAHSDAWVSEHLDGADLIEVTEAEWRECNGRYAPDDVDNE